MIHSFWSRGIEKLRWATCHQAHQAIAAPEDTYLLVGKQKQSYRLCTECCLEMVDANQCSVKKKNQSIKSPTVDQEINLGLTASKFLIPLL